MPNLTPDECQIYAEHLPMRGSRTPFQWLANRHLGLCRAWERDAADPLKWHPPGMDRELWVRLMGFWVEDALSILAKADRDAGEIADD